MPLYVDYNATTPYDKDVKTAILGAMTTAWSNPSSSHVLGKKAKTVVEEARKNVAQMICCHISEIIFTSGGTESNNLVIENAVSYFTTHLKNESYESLVPHIVTTNIEHDSIILHLRALLEKKVIDVSFVPVSKKTGQISVQKIKEAIRNETCLVTVMMANNETGIIQPIREIGLAIEEINSKPEQKLPILFHTDAAQAIGKIEVLVPELKVDFLTVAGHKFYGSRTGALFVKGLMHNPKLLTPLFYGGNQERGYRPGTENVAMIAGLGKAAELVHANLQKYHSDMVTTRDYLEKELLEVFKEKIAFNNIRQKKIHKHDSKVIIEEVPRLPNTVSVVFKSILSSLILANAPDLCASTGAACHSGGEYSNILVNSGVNKDSAQCTLRLSVGRETTKFEIDSIVRYLCKVIFEIS